MNKTRFHIGTLLGLAVMVYLSIWLVQTVRRNYQLKRQVSDLEQKIDTLSNDNEDLRYKIQYYGTDAFKEKEARANLGLQAPGEGVIILPKTSTPVPVTATKPTKKVSNFKQWWQFLFG